MSPWLSVGLLAGSPHHRGTVTIRAIQYQPVPATPWPSLANIMSLMLSSVQVSLELMSCPKDSTQGLSPSAQVPSPQIDSVLSAARLDEHCCAVWWHPLYHRLGFLSLLPLTPGLGLVPICLLRSLFMSYSSELSIFLVKGQALVSILSWGRPLKKAAELLKVHPISPWGSRALSTAALAVACHKYSARVRMLSPQDRRWDRQSQRQAAHTGKRLKQRLPRSQRDEKFPHATDVVSTQRQ